MNLLTAMIRRYHFSEYTAKDWAGFILFCAVYFGVRVLLSKYAPGMPKWGHRIIGFIIGFVILFILF